MGEEDGLVWIDDSMYNPEEGGISPQEMEEYRKTPEYKRVSEILNEC